MKKLKKMAIIMIAIALVICVIFTLAFCGDRETHTHRLTYHRANKPTCTQNGNIEYWSCTECGKNFSDNDGKNEIKNITLQAAHTGGTEIRDAIDATEEYSGYTGDTYCNGCGEMISSGSTIPKLEHVHEFSNEWTSDDLNHWKEAICGHNVNEDFGIHNFINGFCVICDATQIKETEGLEYKLNSDNKSYSVIGCGTVTDKNIIIPRKYNGYPVTVIDKYAFQYSETLESVTIGNNVVSINKGAFYNCDKLKTVIISDSVSTIGQTAFSDCDVLENITIGKGLNKIENEAFDSCRNLINVYISDIVQWCNVSFLGDYSNPLEYADYLYLNNELLKELVVPNEVTRIPEYAFSCKNLVRVELSDNVKTVGAFAFYFCENLVSIKVGERLTEIGESAFYGCSKLVEIINWSSLNFGWSETAFGYIAMYAKEVHTRDSKIEEVDNYLFYTHNNINYLIGYMGEESELILPDTYNGETYRIYDYAFYNRGNLKNVLISNGVTEVGAYAFGYNDKIEQLTIGINVEHFGDDAFSATDVEEIYISDLSAWCAITYSQNASSPMLASNDTNFLYLNGKVITELVIPDGVTSIPKGAFENCKSITSITIPNSVTTIEASAFSGCVGISSIIIPDSVTTVGNGILSNCTGLENVYLSANLETISASMFSGCVKLESIIIPDKVTTIGKHAFSECLNLKSVVIGEGVTRINEYAFAGDWTGTEINDNLVSIEFKNKKGWKAYTNLYYGWNDSISSTDLSNKELAATYLKSTYLECVWKRS